MTDRTFTPGYAIEPRAESVQLTPRQAFLRRVGVRAYAALVANIQRVCPPPTPPARVVPFEAIGTTYYVNPNAATHGNGLSKDTPFQDLRDLPYPASGSAVLFAAGTTYTPSAGFIDIIPDLNADTAGVNQHKTIFGVYDPVTGARVYDGAQRATIDGQNTYPFVLRVSHANARYNICIDGLKCINSLGSGDGRIKLDTVGNCQVLNCDVSDSLAKGIFINGATAQNFVEGNIALNCGEAGVTEYPLFASTTKINYNTLCGVDHGSAYGFNGEIAHNTIIGPSSRTSNGINIASEGGSGHVYGNSVTQCKNGVSITGSGASPGSFTVVIEHNNIQLCKFGISVVNANGGTVQANRIDKSGSYDGSGAFLSDGYGRGIELWGSSPSTGASNIAVRYNLVTRTFGWATNGSEGVGIGFDDNSVSCTSTGNLMIDCQGNGFQSNRTTGCTSDGDVIINPYCAPNGSYSALETTNGRREGGVSLVVSPTFTMKNAVIVCGNVPYLGYGIAEFGYQSDGGSPGARLSNNLIIGAPVGIMRDTTRGKTIEDNNVFEDCSATVVDCTNAAAALGPGSFAVAAGTSGIDAVGYVAGTAPGILKTLRQPSSEVTFP